LRVMIPVLAHSDKPSVGEVPNAQWCRTKFSGCPGCAGSGEQLAGGHPSGRDDARRRGCYSKHSGIRSTAPTQGGVRSAIGARTRASRSIAKLRSVLPAWSATSLNSLILPNNFLFGSNPWLAVFPSRVHASEDQKPSADEQPTIKRQFTSMAFVIVAGSGSDAMILRSIRRTPLRRHSLILAVASPRTTLPNGGKKRPSWRTARVK
jgi:hypothetical protein